MKNKKIFKVILVATTEESREWMQKAVESKHSGSHAMDFKNAVKHHYLDSHQGEETLDILSENSEFVAGVAVKAIAAFYPLLGNNDDAGIILWGFPRTSEQLICFSGSIKECFPNVIITAYAQADVDSNLFALLKDTCSCEIIAQAVA